MSEPALWAPLDAASISHQMAMPLQQDATPDYLALPGSPGVLIVENSDRRTVMVATSANVRELVRRRCEPPAPGERSPKVNMRSLCAGGTVSAIVVGSVLEADAVYLRVARERLPEAGRIVSERWRAWFAHVDPDAEFPNWTKTNLLGLVKTRSASSSVEASLDRGVLLGPIPEKDAAGRFIELTIDAFDLCRFYNLLVGAPTAKACAYKEMGRCPAPCDGTEPMDGYRQRTREAVRLLGHAGLEEALRELQVEVERCAAAQAFEVAALIKKRLDRLSPLQKSTFAHVARLDSWRLVLVLKSPRKTCVRLAMVDRGRLLGLGDIDALDAGAITEVASRAVSWAQTQPSPAIDAGLIDTIGLISRWLHLPSKKRGGEFIAIRSHLLDGDALRAAAKKVAKLKDDTDGLEDREIENL